ncbi:hypothetical protein KAR91_41885 [Candidatus Pacearchaeota archaeon]|nr:hypothetical protein [Candidatus Pacearchaeota archaeon]
MKVLIACEYSGVVRDAFIARGHDAISCDFEPTEKPGPHYLGDVFDIIGEGWDMMIAHPPCTRLANSGVRWLHKPPRGKSLEQIWKELEEGAKFYRKLRDVNIPKRAIENPIMHKYARARIEPRPRQVVQPWWFGDEAFKATGFELIGLPQLKETNRLIPPVPGTDEHKKWSQCHRESPGPERWKNRSRTYQGIAEAMAQQWGNL